VDGDHSNRIQEFTNTGDFIRSWGCFGIEDGAFIAPRGVAVQPSSGNVFVADWGNNRVQKFACP
jgi:DNA-binding beta-propeller fold protein YncE